MRNNNTSSTKDTEQEDYDNRSNQLHSKIAEHNLTHLPYRNWCSVCVQGKGRQDNYKKQQSRQPVIQVDFAYIKSQQDPKTIPVLTAVDVTTQLCRAVMVPDKPSMMDYMVNNLQAFIFECGRRGILQSDNEDTLNALLKSTAAKVGTMSVRHSPSYSSNSQGSVERLHRTLLGQIGVAKAQVASNYSMIMSTKHCLLLPWIVRHAAWTVNWGLVNAINLIWGNRAGPVFYLQDLWTGQQLSPRRFSKKSPIGC